MGDYNLQVAVIWKIQKTEKQSSKKKMEKGYIETKKYKSEILHFALPCMQGVA